MGVLPVVAKTTTILDSAFAVLVQFAREAYLVGVLRVVVITTTILDCTNVVQETQ